MELYLSYSIHSQISAKGDIWETKKRYRSNPSTTLYIQRCRGSGREFEFGSHTYVYQNFTPTLASAGGEVKSGSVTLSDGAQMDSLAAGEWAHLIFKQDQHASNIPIHVIAVMIEEQDGA